MATSSPNRVVILILNTRGAAKREPLFLSLGRRPQTHDAGFRPVRHDRQIKLHRLDKSLRIAYLENSTNVLSRKRGIVYLYLHLRISIQTLYRLTELFRPENNSTLTP